MSLTPLSTEDRYPARQDMTPFWERATRALRGLGPEIITWNFRERHLDYIAPVILEPSVWEIFKYARWDNWAEMTTAVDNRFGLSKR